MTCFPSFPPNPINKVFIFVFDPLFRDIFCRTIIDCFDVKTRRTIGTYNKWLIHGSTVAAIMDRSKLNGQLANAGGGHGFAGNKKKD